MRERFIVEDDRIVHHRVHDVEPALERAKALRDVPVKNLPMSESRLVASVPMFVVSMWLQEAGVQWSDIEAAREVVKRKLMSGDASAFRVDHRSW